VKLTVLSNEVEVVENTASGWDTGSCGQFTEEDLKVRIKKGINKQVKNLTILHEMQHAADFLLSLGLSEKQVQQIALFWFSFIRENPDFIKDIQDDT